MHRNTKIYCSSTLYKHEFSAILFVVVVLHLPLKILVAKILPIIILLLKMYFIQKYFWVRFLVGENLSLLCNIVTLLHLDFSLFQQRLLDWAQSTGFSNSPCEYARSVRLLSFYFGGSKLVRFLAEIEPKIWLFLQGNLLFKQGSTY